MYAAGVQALPRPCPQFERLLVEDGLHLVKYWFSVSDEEQERRFRTRVDDPTRRWKLSGMDLESRRRYVDYSRAKDEMFVHTDMPEAPWWVVEADDKRRARSTASRISWALFRGVPRAGPIELPERQADEGYRRPDRSTQTYVPDHAATLDL